MKFFQDRQTNQSRSNALEESTTVLTAWTILGFMEILYSLKLVLEGKGCEEPRKSSN